jgi:hypothetical protein
MSADAHRPISPDTLAALAGAVAREREALPEDSPRRRPTLAKLACLEAEPDQPAEPRRT